MNTSNISKITHNLAKTVSNNSPGLLMLTGLIGMGAAMVMVAKAAPKAQQILDDLHETQSEDITQPQKTIEEVKAVAKIYAPAAGMALISAGCIVCSYKLSANRIATLATAYGIQSRKFKNYQKTVLEEVGEKKEKLIREKAIQKSVDEEKDVDDKRVINTGKGTTLCYEDWGGRYFWSDIETIRAAVNILNRRLIDEMYISVNDLYDEIGLPPTRLGDQLGWNADDFPINIDFASQLTEKNEACVVVSWDARPRFDFDKLM